MSKPGAIKRKKNSLRQYEEEPLSVTSLKREPILIYKELLNNFLFRTVYYMINKCNCVTRNLETS